MKELATNDSRAHVENVRSNLDELVAHLRRDVTKVGDPKAQALFETTAEVLAGLSKAFEHYANRTEPVWK
jgi:hypothetical protein